MPQFQLVPCSAAISAAFLLALVGRTIGEAATDAICGDANFKLCFFVQDKATASLLCDNLPNEWGRERLLAIQQRWNCEATDLVAQNFSLTSADNDASLPVQVRTRCCSGPGFDRDPKPYLIVYHRKEWQLDAQLVAYLFPFAAYDSRDLLDFRVLPTAVHAAEQQANLVITSVNVSTCNKERLKEGSEKFRWVMPVPIVSKQFVRQLCFQICMNNDWLEAETCMNTTFQLRNISIVPTTIQVKNETRSATFSFIMQNECETLAPQTKFQVTCVPLQSLLRTAHAASFGTRGMCDDKKALNLQITNLQPATQYNCNVTSTFSGSIYSDTKSMQIKTEEDVPSKNPIVAFGVYESLSCNETRCATVYWQIDNSFTYEGVKEVEIVLYANNSVQPMLNVSKVSPTEFYTFSGLSDYEHYTVYLRAANSVGFNERINASALSLPPTQDGASMEAPLFYFDNQQSTLRMEWPAAPAVRLGTQQGALDAQEVSLYCIAVACQLKDKKCGEKVQWHEAACDDLWTNRNVTVAAGAVQQLVQDLTNVKLGVTVNVYRQGQPWQSTGIRWAECVHSLDSTIDANTLDFVSRNTRLSKGHATVQIDGSLPPCSETGVSPMADLVVLRFGLASNNMERQERVCKVTRRQPVGGFIFSCNADGLSAGTTYDFSVLLSARAGVNSTPSVTFSATVTTDGVQLAVLLAVVTSAIVVFVGLMLASIRLYCYYVNKRRKLPKPESKPEENPLKPEYYVANSEFLRGLTVVDSD